MAKKRHEELGLTNEDVLNILKRWSWRVVLDERMWLLNRAGKIPFVISCQGQEAAKPEQLLHLTKIKTGLRLITVIWESSFISG